VGERFDSARMEALSDGVIAIAITLLVLEISVPADAHDDLLDGILDQWPSYLAYVTSFLTTGAAWFVHHHIFLRMGHADRTLAQLNLLFLMVVAFLPFPTTLLASAVHDADAERTAVLFYGGVLVIVLLLLAAMARYVANHPALLDDPVHAPELQALAVRLTPGFGIYALVFALAVVAPRVAAFGFLAIAVGALLGIRGDED
jgi:uncharacterized membrane protein